MYTNVVAKYALEFAVRLGTSLGVAVPPAWSVIAAHIKIPFDAVNQRHPEYDGYAGQTIKQADVVLLGFPLMWPMDDTVRRNDLVYYAERTDPNGPGMFHRECIVLGVRGGNGGGEVCVATIAQSACC